MARFISVNITCNHEIENVIFNIEHIVLVKSIGDNLYRLFLSTGGNFIIREDEYNRVKQLLLGRDRYENR